MSVGAEPGFVELARLRQRDARMILPLTALAAVGALAWLPGPVVLTWFAVNLAFRLTSDLVCRGLLRLPTPGRRHEIGLAAFTFAGTAAYAALPALFLIQGEPTALIAAMAMSAAIALSAGSELTASRPVALAALGATAGALITGFLFTPGHDGLPASAAALIAVTGMFAYVLQAAVHREAVERRLALALSQAQAQEAKADAANAAKSTFLATMSHEIRTPLNGVLGMAQVMARDPLDPIQQQRLEVIRQSGEALTALLNNVLDISKIEAGQMELESIPFDLAELLSHARAAFLPLAAEKGLDLKLEVAAEARATVQGDPTRLRQVIYNLLSNAVKFTPAGEVRLSAGAGPRGLRLVVSDTGPGLAPADQARLFQRFSQLDASTTRRHGGSGLGLAIARQLCWLMGGDLRLESAPGQGASFIVELPLHPVRALKVEAAPADAPVGPHPAEGDASAPLAALRVLAAEDNPINQKVLRALLAPLGVEPQIVEDGAQALEAWAAQPWDLVLMDVRMPVMDGLEATRRIRAREQAEGLAPTPIIGLSADAMAHQVEALLAAGMDAHVAKPIDAARLYGVLEKVV